MKTNRIFKTALAMSSTACVAATAAHAAPVTADVTPTGTVDVTDIFFDDGDAGDISALLDDLEVGLITTTSVQDGFLRLSEETQVDEAFFLPNGQGPLISVSEIDGSSAAARSQAGNLGVFASARGNESLFDGGAATAQSSFFDLITATSASASGDAELSLQFVLDGSLETADEAGPLSSAALALAAGTTSDVTVTSDFDSFDADGAVKSTFESELDDIDSDETFGAALIHNISNFDPDSSTTLDGLFVIDDALTFTIPVVLGEEQGIFTALIASAFDGAEVDFFGSLSLSSVVLSQNGVALSDGTVTGQISGTLLDPSADPIPLPGAIWLFGAGAALILRQRRALMRA